MRRAKKILILSLVFAARVCVPGTAATIETCVFGDPYGTAASQCKGFVDGNTDSGLGIFRRAWIEPQKTLTPGECEKMEKRMAKYLIDVGMLVSGGLCAITGIIKLPGLLRHFDLRSIILPAYQITKIHDLTGVIFVILVIAHLVFNWRWLAGMTQTLMKPPK